MKKILLIFILILQTSLAYSAGVGSKDAKDTASTGVEPATKFDIGKKWISKGKKFEKKKNKLKQKMLMKKL